MLLPTMKAIAQEVAEAHGLSLADLQGPRTFPAVAAARHEAMWRIRQVLREDGTPRYSFTKIGTFFGKRDHSTVAAACKRYAVKSDAPPELMSSAEFVRQVRRLNPLQWLKQQDEASRRAALEALAEDMGLMDEASRRSALEALAAWLA